MKKVRHVYVFLTLIWRMLFVFLLAILCLQVLVNVMSWCVSIWKVSLAGGDLRKIRCADPGHANQVDHRLRGSQALCREDRRDRRAGDDIFRFSRIFHYFWLKMLTKVVFAIGCPQRDCGDGGGGAGGGGQAGLSHPRQGGLRTGRPRVGLCRYVVGHIRDGLVRFEARIFHCVSLLFRPIDESSVSLIFLTKKGILV